MVALYDFYMDQQSQIYVLHGVKHYEKYGMSHHRPNGKTIALLSAYAMAPTK